MPTAKAIARLEALIWILIYGGLFGVVLGIASLSAAPAVAWSLIVVGAIVAAVGAGLILVRARLSEDAGGGAQSSTEPRSPDA